jgi:acetoin utilization protein AcuB
MFMDDAATLAEVDAHLGPGHPAKRRLAASTVGELMARNVVTLEGDQPLQEAIKLFGGRRFRHILVTNNGILLGVLSDRDVFRFLAENPSAREAAVAVVMTPKPLTVAPDTSMADAIRLIVRNRINCLPVVAEGGKVEGIVTTTDFLRMLFTLQWLEQNPHT